MEQVMNENANYRVALYCRLSKDDEQTGESVSIETQRMMLTGFCYERGFKIYEVYTDDGYSGLNFNRPAFQRMLEDIDRGKVNMVITKDLSRLGRDYIQTGYYTDIYFSQKKVLKAVLNEYFDRDILTPTLLVKLIERIEVGHIEKNGVNRGQEITIYYRFIGAAE